LDRFQLRAQQRQMDRDDLPNAHQVYAQIIVDEDISEAGNRPPVNLGMRCLQSTLIRWVDSASV
jgi:hypothetical protein